MAMFEFLRTLALAVAAGGGFSGVGWLTYLKSSKTRRATAVIASGKLELDSRRVEGEAYANAQKISDDAVKGLHTDIDYLRRELRTEREGRAEDNRVHAREIVELRSLISAQQTQIAQLQTELDVTRAQLRIPGITTDAEGS